MEYLFEITTLFQGSGMSESLDNDGEDFGVLISDTMYILQPGHGLNIEEQEDFNLLVKHMVLKIGQIYLEHVYHF